MPKFVNKNAHPVRYGTDASTRLVPGQVVDVDGKDADTLKAMAGVEAASQTDVKAWEDSQNAGVLSPENATNPINSAIAEFRQATSNLLAALNGVVIGDDQAPYGPPTGTVTTKQAAGREEPQQFGQNEAFQVGKVEGDVADVAAAPAVGILPGREIHNAQVSAQEKVGELTDEVVDVLKAAQGSSDDGEGDESGDGDGGGENGGNADLTAAAAASTGDGSGEPETEGKADGGESPAQEAENSGGSAAKPAAKKK